MAPTPRHAAAHSKDMVALDYQFHSIIAGALHSRTLQLCREPIGQLFLPACLRLVFRLNVVERMVFAHEQILDGLRNHDVGKARLWMTKHIVDSKRGYDWLILMWRNLFPGPLTNSAAWHDHERHR